MYNCSESRIGFTIECDWSTFQEYSRHICMPRNDTYKGGFNSDDDDNFFWLAQEVRNKPLLA